jgi:hypothetical protein
MNESGWSEYVGKRIGQLSMCTGKREALMDELRYAAQVGEDLQRLERYGRGALDRGRAVLAMCVRRVVGSVAPAAPRVHDKA